MDVTITDIYVIFDAGGDKLMKVEYEVRYGSIRIIGRIIPAIGEAAEWATGKLEQAVEADLRDKASIIAEAVQVMEKYRGQKISLDIDELFKQSE